MMSALFEYLRISSRMKNETFSLSLYHEVFEPALACLLPLKSTRMPYQCDSWKDVLCNFYVRVVIYNDNLILKNPRLISKIDQFSEIYDGNRVLMTLNALRPDSWTEHAVELILSEQSGPRGHEMYSRIVDQPIAMKVEFSFPTMQAHLAENTRLLEVQSNKIEIDQHQLQRQYFQKDYRIIERQPCDYNLRSVRESFMTALPADDRRIDAVLAAKIPQALENAVEYDRLIKSREDEVQQVLTYEREKVRQGLNNVMTCLNEHFMVTPGAPSGTTLRRYCCTLEFEHLRMLSNSCEMFQESIKSVLRQCLDVEVSAYADTLRGTNFAPIPSLINQTTGLLASDNRRFDNEDLEVQQYIEHIDGNGDLLLLNLPRRIVHNTHFTPLDYEAAHALQSLNNMDVKPEIEDLCKLCYSFV